MMLGPIEHRDWGRPFELSNHETQIFRFIAQQPQQTNENRRKMSELDIKTAATIYTIHLPEISSVFTFCWRTYLTRLLCQ
jgi:hypothetical protein